MSKADINTYGGRLFNAGIEGQIVDQEFAQIDSFVNTSATGISFGRLVVRDTTVVKGCKPMAADTDLQLGVSARHPMSPASTDGVNTVVYKQYESVPVLIDGVIFVTAAEQVRQGDQVLALTAGAGTFGGSRGGVAGAGRVDVPNALWVDDVLANAVGRIRVKNTGTRRVTT